MVKFSLRELGLKIFQIAHHNMIASNLHFEILDKRFD